MGPAEQLKQKPSYALTVALVVAVVCALVVSIAAVTLRPLDQANLKAEREARLASILEALESTVGTADGLDIQARVVELDTGAYDDSIDANLFDTVKAGLDPATSTSIPPESDPAGLKRRANHAVVYLSGDDTGKPELIILPVWGVGYQSALRGFLALDGKAERIYALKFYEQGETPGLGSRIQDAEWEAKWPGKQPYNANREVQIEVGGSGHSRDVSRVDGISGATRTTQGVNTLIRFWLGDLGFGPYLERLRDGDN